MSEVYEFLFVKGGPVMFPIVLGSVLALAFFLERAWALRSRRVVPRAFYDRVRQLVSEGKISEAEVLSQENGSSLAIVVAGALRQAGRPLESIKEAVNEVGRREVAQMERLVEMLGTVAAVEPLLGLLGTVTGLIKAFQSVELLASKGGGVNPGILAAGIWEALVTTAVGLTIAIPSYVGYRYLHGRLNVLVIEVEEDALEIAELIDSVKRPVKRPENAEDESKQAVKDESS